MTSKEALKELRAAAISKWGLDRVNIIKQDLDRLEKLEKVIEILKARVKMFEIYHEPKNRYYYLYIGGRIVFLSREEYEILKEVLENGL